MTMETPAWLTKSFAATRQLSDLSDEMHGVARALVIAGNRELAERVCAWAEEVGSAADEARGAMSESISESLRDSERATGNMLMALLAGATINGSPEQRESIAAIAQGLTNPDKANGDQK